MSRRGWETRDKEVRALVRRIREAGHDVRKTSQGHFLVTGPRGTATISAKLGGWNSRGNMLATLRKAGIVL